MLADAGGSNLKGGQLSPASEFVVQINDMCDPENILLDSRLSIEQAAAKHQTVRYHPQHDRLLKQYMDAKARPPVEASKTYCTPAGKIKEDGLQ